MNIQCRSYDQYKTGRWGTASATRERASYPAAFYSILKSCGTGLNLAEARMETPMTRESGRSPRCGGEAPTAVEEMMHRSRLGLLLTMTEGQILRFEPYIPFLVGGRHRRVQATTRGVGVRICPGGGRGEDFLRKR